jgi:hypothetical protein
LRVGEEGQHPPLGVDHHRHLGEQAGVAQAVLDLLGLHAKAADLHLVVASPAQLDALGGPFADIAGPVGPERAAIGQAQFDKALGRQQRIVQVTQPDAGPGDVQLAGVCSSTGRRASSRISTWVLAIGRPRLRLLSSGAITRVVASTVVSVGP